MRYSINRLKTFYKKSLNCCIGLCYHRVGKNIHDFWQNAISIKNFQDHMEYISKKYLLVSTDELIQAINNREFPSKRMVFVTFDDGYSINCTYACDILTKLKVPALFYTTTYTLDEEENFWWDQLQNMFYNNKEAPNYLTLTIMSTTTRIPVYNNLQMKNAIFIIHRILKALDSKSRKAVINNLLRQFKVNDSNYEYKPFTKVDIRNISKIHLFDIGGHAHSHCALSLLDYDSQQQEIVKSKILLESIIGKPISNFSYPFGDKVDYDDNTVKILRDVGYHSASTTQRRFVRKNDDLYQLPRLSVHNWDLAKFAHVINELWWD